MDLKAVVLFLCLSALAITSVEAGIPKCCVRTIDRLPPPVALRKLDSWYTQQSNGACDIEALVLYVKTWRRPICVHTKMTTALTKILKKMDNKKRKRQT